MAKAIELFEKPGELGNPEGYFNLGIIYRNGDGVDVDPKKTRAYFEKSACMGLISARFALGLLEWKEGNIQRAIRHLSIAAKAGHKNALDLLKEAFKVEYVTKDEFEEALRAYHKSDTERSSENRTAAKTENIWGKNQTPS